MTRLIHQRAARQPTDAQATIRVAEIEAAARVRCAQIDAAARTRCAELDADARVTTAFIRLTQYAVPTVCGILCHYLA